VEEKLPGFRTQTHLLDHQSSTISGFWGHVSETLAQDAGANRTLGGGKEKNGPRSKSAVQVKTGRCRHLGKAASEKSPKKRNTCCEKALFTLTAHWGRSFNSQPCGFCGKRSTTTKKKKTPKKKGDPSEELPSKKSGPGGGGGGAPLLFWQNWKRTGVKWPGEKKKGNCKSTEKSENQYLLTGFRLQKGNPRLPSTGGEFATNAQAKKQKKIR